jgi:hypothetical protein
MDSNIDESGRRIRLEEYFHDRRLGPSRRVSRFADVRVAFVGHARLAVPESAWPVEGEERVLSYGLHMPVPILDLAATDDGISATLSFGRSPHATFVPWEAVVGLRGYGELNNPADPGGPPKSKLTLVP